MMLMSDESAGQHAAPMAAVPPTSLSTKCLVLQKKKKKKNQNERNPLLVEGYRHFVHDSKNSFKGVVNFILREHERERQSKIPNPRLIDLREE